MSDNITKYLVKFSQEEYEERTSAEFTKIRQEAVMQNALDANTKKKFILEQTKHQRQLATERKQRQRER
jgi:hypothetical protein